MTPPTPVFRENPGRLGGLAAARRMSAEARAERAAKGGNALARMYGLEHYARIAAASGERTRMRQTLHVT